MQQVVRGETLRREPLNPTPHTPMRQIMYEETLKREEGLRGEMALIATHYLTSFSDKGVSDRVAVLDDIFQSETAFYESLKLLVGIRRINLNLNLNLNLDLNLNPNLT